MSDKKISYLSRDFSSVRKELEKFSKQYYPELSDDWNDSSVGSWLMDLAASVGDDLAYHTDRMYQESTLDSANMRSSVLSQARSNGLKIPGRKASSCEVEISCVLPTDSTDISVPNWNYAPIVQSTSIISAGDSNFQLTEDINFAEQFNKNGYSNRKVVPSRNSNGNITGYTVSKSAIAVNGTTKVYKKVMYPNDIEPFMEIVLPEENILNIESIIFKESSDITTTPSIYEYYIDSEQYRISSEDAMTYRFFECDSLADQYRFGDSVNYGTSNIISSIYEPSLYDDYTSNGAVTRYYRGKWKPLRQKFITEYTDNGYMKVIFGASNGYPQLPSNGTTYGDYVASNIINNDMLGVLPKEGWTMFILYRVGGGVSSNLGIGALNKFTLANVDWGANTNNTNGSIRGKVLTSLTVTNISSALAGKDSPSTSEIKYLMKYNTSSQNRAVTVTDYRAKLMEMPPKYGAPFRCSVIEENNKVEMDFLGLDSNGNLTSYLPQTLVENSIEYLSNFKQINDYIEIKSGKIYNIGVMAEMFIDKNYNQANVVTSVINKIKEYFSVNNHEMGDDIFVGDLEKEIMLLDGVIGIIRMKIYKIYNGGYSSDVCPLPETSEESVCGSEPSEGFSLKDEGSISREIDLDATDYVLYGDYNSMYEIKSPSSDIQIKIKTR
mgnify:FL=1